MIRMNSIGLSFSKLEYVNLIIEEYMRFIHLMVFCFSWEAGQLLARKLMLSLVADFQQNKPLALNPKFVQGLRSILCDTSLDKV